MASATHDAAWRFYLLLALFDRRDGSALAGLVQAAREGYEREPDEDAWAPFDALWNRYTSSERLALAFGVNQGGPHAS